MSSFPYFVSSRLLEQSYKKTGRRLLLGAEAPATTPNSIDFFSGGAESQSGCRLPFGLHVQLCYAVKTAWEVWIAAPNINVLWMSGAYLTAEGDAKATTVARQACCSKLSSTCDTGCVSYVFSLTTSNPLFLSPVCRCAA